MFYLPPHHHTEMTLAPNDKVFAGSIPQLYQTMMVPLIFQPYADDLARRISSLKVSRILEIACGTGVVTRALDESLDPGVAIVATDLNPAMLEEARAQGTRRAVDWRPADAMTLPFPDASFDCVACQFGVMFFPDKAHAFAEARRVLRPGGTFLFNAWDRIEENDFALAVLEALASLFPADPPRFMARTPHGYHDIAAIRRDLAAGGFPEADIQTVAARSRAASARDPAVAYCQGTPWRAEIEARGSLEEATRVSAAAIESRFGAGPVDGKIQAHVVMVTK
jgi:ubiquinone/menaquinone biosynthesis C-methylase UbiE